MRKITVFLIVIAFHLVVMGVVYFITRDGNFTETPDKEVVQPPKNDNNSTGGSTDQTPPDNGNNNTNNNTNSSTGSSGYIFHTVGKGDFLSKIAEKYKVSAQEILTLNNIKDANKIMLGQKLKIPKK